jgi:Zn-dependent protease with chaperone function
MALDVDGFLDGHRQAQERPIFSAGSQLIRRRRVTRRPLKILDDDRIQFAVKAADPAKVQIEQFSRGNRSIPQRLQHLQRRRIGAEGHFSSIFFMPIGRANRLQCEGQSGVFSAPELKNPTKRATGIDLVAFFNVGSRCRLFLLLFLAIFAIGCAAAPVMDSWTQQQGGVIADARQARAQAVAANLASYCRGIPITVHVLASDAPCAYAWPSGHIFVTRGLMDMLTDDELSAAIAHEMGHLLSDGQLHTIVALAGCSMDGDRESRADAQGIALLQARGLPPSAMIHMLEKVEASPQVPPQFKAALQMRIALLSRQYPGR